MRPLLYLIALILTRGNALVRRATDCRFLCAFSSCHLDIVGPSESVPWCRKAFVTNVTSGVTPLSGWVGSRCCRQGDGKAKRLHFLARRSQSFRVCVPSFRTISGA